MRCFFRRTTAPHDVLDQPISNIVRVRTAPTRRNAIVPVIAQHNELDQQISERVRGRPVPTHNELDQEAPIIKKCAFAEVKLAVKILVLVLNEIEE